MIIEIYYKRNDNIRAQSLTAFRYGFITLPRLNRIAEMSARIIETFSIHIFSPNHLTNFRVEHKQHFAFCDHELFINPLKENQESYFKFYFIFFERTKTKRYKKNEVK